MEDSFICPAEITADKDREPFFSVNSPYDLEAVYFGRKYSTLHSSNNFTVISAAVSLVMSIASAVMGYYLITIASGIIFLITVWVIAEIKPSAKRIYSRLYEGEALRRYSFYDDHFTVETVKGAAYINYGILKKAVFGERYILLFLPDGENFIIDKNKTENEGLTDFLKAKLP